MNPYEQANRERKVGRLLEVLAACEYGSRIARTFDERQWRIVAALANCNPPSPTTVAAVIAALVEREQMRQIHAVAVAETKRLLGEGAKYLPGAA